MITTFAFEHLIIEEEQEFHFKQNAFIPGKYIPVNLYYFTKICVCLSCCVLFMMSVNSYVVLKLAAWICDIKN